MTDVQSTALENATILLDLVVDDSKMSNHRRKRKGSYNNDDCKDSKKLKCHCHLDKLLKSPSGNNYDMDHSKRGRAIIFNHVYCEGHSAPRRGTEKDVDRLQYTLKNCLGFEVFTYTDLTHDEIMTTLENLSRENFEHEDCLAIFVLTHGSLHKLTAKDNSYSIDDLWKYFTPDKCTSLAAKPKLFFINSCRGRKYDEGVLYEKFNSTTSNAENEKCDYHVLRIPIYADFLTFYSTMEGYISVRHALDGTWFIQSLCDTIEDKDFRKLELKEMLTIVARKTAIKCNAYNEAISQMPTLMSTLIRNVYFS